MEYYLHALRNWKDFSGRASRSHFWMYALMNAIFTIAAISLDYLLLEEGPMITGVYALITLVPSLALAVRRLHDINKSGWWIFIMLVPYIGPLYLIYLYAKAGDEKKNNYGAAPKPL